MGADCEYRCPTCRVLKKAAMAMEGGKSKEARRSLSADDGGTIWQ